MDHPLGPQAVAAGWDERRAESLYEIVTGATLPSGLVPG